MIRKVCPICEEPMRLPHYCTGCRQFVRTPWKREITYYLNESHPEGETDCDYHVRPSAAAIPDGGRRRNGVRRKALGFFIGAVIAAQVIPLAVIYGYRRLADMPVNTCGGALSYEEVPESRVRDRGEPCNSRNHYSITGSEMARELEPFIEEAGYVVRGTETRSDNMEIIELSETYYETRIDYYVCREGDPGEETWEVVVRYDTGTGQLHGVGCYLPDRDGLTAMAGAVVGILQDHGQLPPAPDYGEIMEDRLREYFRQEGEEPEESGYWLIPEEGEDQTGIYIGYIGDCFYLGIEK